MIWNLDFSWLTLMVACVGILAFILALALDAIMKKDGFGPIGNTAVLTGGFFLTIFLFNIFGHNLSDMGRAATVGVSGSFVTMAVLAIGKGLLNRML